MLSPNTFIVSRTLTFPEVILRCPYRGRGQFFSIQLKGFSSDGSVVVSVLSYDQREHSEEPEERFVLIPGSKQGLFLRPGGRPSLGPDHGYKILLKNLDPRQEKVDFVIQALNPKQPVGIYRGEYSDYLEPRQLLKAA